MQMLRRGLVLDLSVAFGTSTLELYVEEEGEERKASVSKEWSLDRVSGQEQIRAGDVMGDSARG